MKETRYHLVMWDEYGHLQHKDITIKYSFKSKKQAIWWLYNESWKYGIDIIQNYDIVKY